ncbi:hypothetical protein [Kitasatospora sp. HPMI-4]|uniref:hypothetical protein n=1 Tax=Kitasatospora sp. HPMI-4 TaxID=3448443 RepID=UPI003F1AD9AE
MCLVQGLSIGMVIGPVTAGLMSALPLERAGAGSAFTGAVLLVTALRPTRPPA